MEYSDNQVMNKILLIDDDTLLRGQIHEGLAQAGYDVADATSGEEGLKLFPELRPDLVITDIVMDNGEGIEAIMNLRKLAAEIPIIAISGNILYLHHSKQLGATDILEKPFRMAHLLDMITRVNGQGS